MVLGIPSTQAGGPLFLDSDESPAENKSFTEVKLRLLLLYVYMSIRKASAGKYAVKLYWKLVLL